MCSLAYLLASPSVSRLGYGLEYPWGSELAYLSEYLSALLSDYLKESELVYPMECALVWQSEYLWGCQLECALESMWESL